MFLYVLSGQLLGHFFLQGTGRLNKYISKLIMLLIPGLLGDAQTYTAYSGIERQPQQWTEFP